MMTIENDLLTAVTGGKMTRAEKTALVDKRIDASADGGFVDSRRVRFGRSRDGVTPTHGTFGVFFGPGSGRGYEKHRFTGNVDENAGRVEDWHAPIVQ